ncbi:MAG: hypothetical protein R3E79_29010 [Caldilineaceae bacterium]
MKITNAGDERLFVVQQSGQIRIVQPDGTVLATPFWTSVIGSWPAANGAC